MITGSFQSRLVPRPPLFSQSQLIEHVQIVILIFFNYYDSLVFALLDFALCGFCSTLVYKFLHRHFCWFRLDHTGKMQPALHKPEKRNTTLTTLEKVLPMDHATVSLVHELILFCWSSSFLPPKLLVGYFLFVCLFFCLCFGLVWFACLFVFPPEPHCSQSLQKKRKCETILIVG